MRILNNVITKKELLLIAKNSIGLDLLGSDIKIIKNVLFIN